MRILGYFIVTEPGEQHDTPVEPLARLAQIPYVELWTDGAIAMVPLKGLS